jgi:hypothetical protein
MARVASKQPQSAIAFDGITVNSAFDSSVLYRGRIERATGHE